MANLKGKKIALKILRKIRDEQTKELGKLSPKDIALNSLLKKELKETYEALDWIEDIYDELKANGR